MKTAILAFLATGIAILELSAEESVDFLTIEQSMQATQGTAEKNETKEKSPDRLTGNLSFFSDYRSRGLSETMHHPAIQGEIKYVYQPIGFYAKTWASNIGTSNNLINNASLEWDLFLGVTNNILGSSLSYDIGFIFYYYPGGKAYVPQNTSYNTIEYYVGFEYLNFRFKAYRTLTDFYGLDSKNPPTNFRTYRLLAPNGGSRGSTYFELEYDWTINSKFKFSFHTGYQIIINYPKLNYLDWQAACIYDFDWIQAVLYYSGSTAKPSYYSVPDNAYEPKRINLGASGVVFGVVKTF